MTTPSSARTAIVSALKSPAIAVALLWFAVTAGDTGSNVLPELEPGSLAALQEELSLASAQPVVVKTVPPAGSDGVDPTKVDEIQVTFSKDMLAGTWSWATASAETFPEVGENPTIRYLDDGRTCVLPVKLEHGKTYAVWINSPRHGNFKDKFGQSALPYLLVFETAEKE